jgi:hypothetical protein
VATNLYREGHIDSTTDLFLRSSNWPVIDLVNITETGQLMGGKLLNKIVFACTRQA